jgi:drug/metabolite transporter (DMT)-like permease
VIATDRRSYLLAYGAFALLALIWGFSYVLIKVGVEAMPATVAVLIRVGTGALTMLAAFAVLRRRLVPPGFRRLLPGFLLMALTSSVIPFIAITWGQYYITTGLASILNATTPLWTAIFAWWVTPNERPSRINYLGVGAGFLGTAILIGPQVVANPFQASALAALAVLLGAVSYAVAALGQRRLLAGVDPQDATLWQLIFASLLMLVIAAPALPSAHPDARALGAVILLGVAGSAFAYILYYYILNSLGATRGSSVTFVVPITAVFWGVVLFHERLTPSVLAGMAVILFGIVLTSVRRRRPPTSTESEPRAAEIRSA